MLLAAFETVASQDDLAQRRIGQIGQVIGAVEDVAEKEQEKGDGTGSGKGATVAEKRVEEAHDIIHRIAKIGDGGTDDDALREVPWDGKFDGETIELKEDEEE